MMRLEEAGRQQDEALLGGAVRQAGAEDGAGVGVVPRRVLRAGAGGARPLAADGALVPGELLQRVLTLLADYRAEHRLLGDEKAR